MDYKKILQVLEKEVGYVEGKNNDLSRYRYYAIESMDGVEYNYELEEDDDDLIVTVTLPKK